MAAVSGGQWVRSCLQRWRPPCASVSAFASCNLCERGDARRRRRGWGSALAKPHGAAQHTLQRSQSRRWRLVQVAIIAAGARAASRRGPTSDGSPAKHRGGDVDVHLAFNHSRSSFIPTFCLLILLLLLLLLLLVLIIITIISLEKKQSNFQQ